MSRIFNTFRHAMHKLRFNPNDKPSLSVKLKINNLLEQPRAIVTTRQNPLVRVFKHDLMGIQYAPNHNYVIASVFQKNINYDNQREMLKIGSDKLNSMTDHEIQNAAIKLCDDVTHIFWVDYLATTMIGQGKTAFEAELDAGSAVDFINFNIHAHRKFTQKYSTRLTNEFGLAITPFHSTSVALNMILSHLMYRNPVAWFVSPYAVLSNHLIYHMMITAGFPKEAISFMPCATAQDCDSFLCDPDLRVINDASESQDVREIIQIKNELTYRNHPVKYLYEKGRTNIHFADDTADIQSTINQTLSSAFSYAGQNSLEHEILYVPQNQLNGYIYRFRSSMKNWRNLYPAQNNILSAITIRRGLKIDYILSHVPANDLIYITDPSPIHTVTPCVIINPDLDLEIKLKECSFAPFLIVKGYEESLVDILKKIDADNQTPIDFAFFSQDLDNQKMAKDILAKIGTVYINPNYEEFITNRLPFSGSYYSRTTHRDGKYSNEQAWFTDKIIFHKDAIELKI